MRTAALLLGILGAFLILGFGAFLFGIGFGQVERRIPDFWSFVLLAFAFAFAGSVATRWHVPLAVFCMVCGAAIWLMLDWQMMQTLNLFGTARGTFSSIVLMLLPPGLLGFAVYLALGSQKPPETVRRRE